MASYGKRRGYRESFSLQTKYEAFYKGGNVQFTSDGELMLCCCENKVQIVNIESGKVVNTIEVEDELTSFIVGNDDCTLIVSLKNGLLLQWNISENKLIRKWKSIHLGPISCMAFNEDTTFVATGGSDSSIKVWDIVRQYCTHNLKGAQGVFSVVRFHPDKEQMLVFGAADDYAIRVWDLNKSQCIHVLSEHFSVVTSLAFTKECGQMLSAGRDSVVIVWDIKSFESLKTIAVFESVQSVMVIPFDYILPNSYVDPDDLHFTIAGEKGVLSVWNSSSGNKVYSQQNPVSVPTKDSDAIIMQAMFISTKNMIAVVTYEHSIILCDLEEFEVKKQFSGHNDEILDIKCMGENESYIAVATNSPHIKIFELSTFNCQLLRGHTDLVVSIDVFPSNHCILVSGSKDDTVRAWRMDSDGDVMCIYTGYGHTRNVTAIACTRQSHSMFVSGSEDMTIKLWTLPEKIPLVLTNAKLSSKYTVHGHDKYINSIVISPNDSLIATGSQDKTIKLWNISDLSLVGVIAGHRRGIWCVQFSPADQVLASSSADGTIKIWSLTDFTCVKSFEGHECSVLKFIFLSNGMQLMSSGSDGNIKLWTIKTNESIKTLDSHTDKVWAMTALRSEEIVITGGADSCIFVWKDVTKDEQEIEITRKENVILQEQELNNLLKKQKWLKALSITVALDQPFRALNILKEILLDSVGREKLEDIIVKMSNDEISKLLDYCVVWNTNSKHCYPAQMLLSIILHNFTPEELLKFPNGRTCIQELSPYTERHLKRISKLSQQCMFIDFMLQNMKVAV